MHNRLVVCSFCEVDSLEYGIAIAREKTRKGKEVRVFKETHLGTGQSPRYDIRWREEFDWADDLHSHVCKKLGIDEEDVFVRHTYHSYGDEFVVYVKDDLRKKVRRFLGKTWCGLPVNISSFFVEIRNERYDSNSGPGPVLYIK